ncbi:MAG: hypothetical protein HY058_17890, partial [Proteobacteria bacterium]|nr:hypothetical protein [Pseudomonadota bacterium]
MGLVILALLSIGSEPGWAQLTKNMTVALNGTGTGSVTSVPVGINCPASACSASFPTLTSLVLVFTPAAGSSWAAATGDCSSTGFQTVAVNYTLVLDTDKACTITFAVVQNSLSVTLAGSGSGTVTSSPAGINCSAGTCSASFNQGTAVTLTASPGAGSTFAG